VNTTQQQQQQQYNILEFYFFTLAAAEGEKRKINSANIKVFFRVSESFRLTGWPAPAHNDIIFIL